MASGKAAFFRLDQVTSSCPPSAGHSTYWASTSLAAKQSDRRTIDHLKQWNSFQAWIWNMFVNGFLLPTRVFCWATKFLEPRLDKFWRKEARRFRLWKCWAICIEILQTFVGCVCASGKYRKPIPTTDPKKQIPWLWSMNKLSEVLVIGFWKTFCKFWGSRTSKPAQGTPSPILSCNRATRPLACFTHAQAFRLLNSYMWAPYGPAEWH